MQTRESMKRMGSARNWAVKRARVMTTFQHAINAWEYWRVTLGAVMMRRTERGWEAL